jgi:hypothetical protein
MVGATTATVFFLIPVWDQIIGSLYFQHLCRTEGGSKVYKTVRLGPEYWSDGVLDRKSLERRFEFPTVSQEKYSRLFNIKLGRDLVVDTRTNEVIGSDTYFIHFGGWLVNSVGFHVRGASCPASKLDKYQAFLQKVFKPL